MDALHRIRDLLAGADESTVGTSMRLPTALRDAAAIAVGELGVAGSTTSLAAGALRAELEALVAERALAAHYDEYPTARPTLAELALAAAELDGSTLADDRELLERSAEAVLRVRPDADADDVLLWAEAVSSGAT